MKQSSFFIVVLILIILVLVAEVVNLTTVNRHSLAPSPSPVPTITVAPEVEVSAPLPGAVVTSPLSVTGVAKGGWFFEGQFPVRLVDASGREVASGVAHAQGDWMTSESVSFKATLTFESPGSGNGELVLSKDNPSGLPQYDQQVRIPIQF